jgi:hypothetical protein
MKPHIKQIIFFSNSFREYRVIAGNDKSITALKNAHDISNINNFLCGLKYEKNIKTRDLF